MTAGGSSWSPCDQCGDTRISFDDRYRTCCFTCGQPRIKPDQRYPTLPPPGSPLPSDATTFERVWTGEFAAQRRTRDSRRIRGAIVLAGFVLFAILIAIGVYAALEEAPSSERPVPRIAFVPEAARPGP